LARRAKPAVFNPIPGFEDRICDLLPEDGTAVQSNHPPALAADIVEHLLTPVRKPNRSAWGTIDERE
jgi:hypothetical protein